MKRNLTSILIAAALTLNAALAFGADTPAREAEAARAQAEKARGDAEAQRAQAEKSRAEAEHELDEMRTQMRELSRKMADVSAKLGDVGPRNYAYRYLGDPNHAMIGVVLGDGDHGVHINAVTPGGPADKAGVRHGDILVAVDGKRVTDEDRAMESLRDLKIDQSVKLTVLRDGKDTDIAVKAERREPYNIGYAFDSGEVLPPDFGAHIQQQVERAMSHAQMSEQQAERIAERAQRQAERVMERVHVTMPWWGVNLASLNPDLGGYFGADKGVLVLSADDSMKGLKAGDVLQQIGGEPVQRPEDAFRLLRQQPSGSDVKVQVLRQHKPLTLSMKAPDSHSIFVPRPPLPPPPPAAPAVPAVPAVPAPRAVPVPPAPPEAPTPPQPPLADESA
jgi:C-terminal processing protease CtpA/Prc